MKTNKIFSLDVQLVERLKKKENASEFVNKVLTDYLDREEFLNLDQDQLRIELQKIEIREEAERKIKELENGRFKGNN